MTIDTIAMETELRRKEVKDRIYMCIMQYDKLEDKSIYTKLVREYFGELTK